MNVSRLRKDLEARKNKAGLVGTRLDLNEVDGDSLSAHITHDWRTIDISYGSNLDLVPDQRTERFVKAMNISDPELKVGLDIMDHETGHRENPVGTLRGCPHTVEMHDAIKESVFRALQERGKTGLESYVTNAFEDVLDNVNCRVQTDFSGQTLFWNNQGLVASQEETYNPFYEAFVRVNLLLGGNVRDASLLKRFYSNADEVKNAVKGFINDVKSSLDLESVVRLHENTQGFNHLFTTDITRRERLWTGLAYSFALRMADLLDEQDMPKETMFGSGQGKGDPTEPSDDGDSDNPFDKAMEDPKNKQEVAFSRYKEGKGPALHRDTQEQLYDLYKKISKEVVVRTSTYSESMSMPLVHYGRRFASGDETKLKFRGVGINEEGELRVKTTRHTIDHPVAYKTHPKQFPKFKLALMDRSGSMNDSPNNDGNTGNKKFIPWGDNSKYHYALKGYFGIENYLERQGINPYVKCGAIGFSGEATIRGDAKTVAKSLLYTPRGGTSLDVAGLEEQLSEGSLVLSISDGELSLSSNEKERLERKLSTQNVDFAHVQIGGETAFSQYLRNIGVPVFTVKGDDDLSTTMIDFVARYYNNIKKGGSS